MGAALDEAVARLGARLRATGLGLGADMTSAVSEALRSVYLRGFEHGLRCAADDLERRLGTWSADGQPPDRKASA